MRTTTWLGAERPLSLVVTVFAVLSQVHSLAQAAASSSNDSLLWGPYRPNLYLGIRPRIPESVSAGLLWTAPLDYQQSLMGFRYTCEQTESMAGYGWDEYDIRTGGRQTIHDAANHLDMTTLFAKVPGGEHGGSWGIRISGKVRDDVPMDMPSTVVFYVSNEGLGSMSVQNEYDERGYEGNVNVAGSTPDLGDFNFEITTGPKTNSHPESGHEVEVERPLDRTRVNTLQMPPQVLWQGKGILFQEMRKTVESYQERFERENMPQPPQAFTIATNNLQLGNFILIQKTFSGSFEFDVLFTSLSAGTPMTSETLTKAIEDNSKGFNEKYKLMFPAHAPFDTSKYSAFSKSMFSNLLGGIGYFYGDQVIDKSYASEYDEDNEGFWEEAAEARARNQQSNEGPYELFTAIPSRPFFPRGFLWDEGFHLMPILDWDVGLTIEILRSWFNTMDQDGWIPREQILGQEARSKVPAEFQVQYPHYANPPTLFIVLEALADKLSTKQMSASDKQIHADVLRGFYPLMKRHYEWYRRTQKGDMKTFDRGDLSSREGYRWRGRTPAHILTSGLDDYPRAQPPHPGELHVDLISWIGMMSRSMKRIAEHLSENEDAREFAKHEAAITKNIDELHWDDAAQTYCDSTVDDFEEVVRVCHKGYISIFPFLTGMLSPESPHLGAVLDLISDSGELWSAHGIRSLSKNDEFYGTEENYWRSPVWMNMNYLILDKLLKTAMSKGPQQNKAKTVYTDLRKNLVETVYKSWKDTGFAWEQYNPETGQGQRTQHFTGWTSLVVKMMAMPDLSSGGASHGEL